MCSILEIGSEQVQYFFLFLSSYHHRQQNVYLQGLLLAAPFECMATEKGIGIPAVIPMPHLSGPAVVPYDRSYAEHSNT